MDDYGFNIDNWEYFCSYSRWFPDSFLDLTKPPKGGLNLHLDQRIYLRVMLRFTSFYGVFPRGYGKTFDEVLASMLACIFFPEISISLSAQTKENAADLLKDKYNEILRFYPLLKNEIDKANFAKGDALVVFKNGSRLDNLANSQTSKGQRRKRINMEESALIDNDTFLDALLPIVEVPRVCVGKYSIVDPEELNQQINFFTTAGFKGSDEYQRSVDMVKDMINLNGKIVLGSSFWLPCWYGRGSTKSQIFQKKRDMTMISFAQNYESKWVGAASGALVNINKLMNCRSLTSPVLSSKNKEDEFYIGVDVARSQNTSNNQSFISVIKVNRTKDKTKIVSMDLVNLINIPNIMNFTAQACVIKKYKKLYNAKNVIVDGNGLGAGLIDELLKESFDQITKESLGCWDTINDDNMPEVPEIAEKILYNLKAQSAQSKIVTNFIDVVDSGKFRMLESKQQSEFTEKEYDDFDNCIAPYLQTDCLFEEIANLKLKHLSNGGVTIEKVVNKLDKDRVSATIYVLWYINEFCRDIYAVSDYEFTCLIN
jgi:ribonucleoside-diphosphate reductase alpha chain